MSASWGEDDIWDVALTYEKELGDFEVAAGIAYTENTDNDDDGPLDHETIAGSISIIHNPTGLNFTFAAGERQFNDVPARADADFYYLKAGIYQRFNSLGKTAIYGEFGEYNNFLYADGTAGGPDAAIVDALDSDLLGACTGAGGCMVTGSEAQVWGVGLVQYIDAAAMQLYIAYRHHEVDFDVINTAGGAVGVNGIEDFSTVLAGGRIEF